MREPMFVLELKLSSPKKNAIDYIVEQVMRIATTDPQVQLTIMRRVVEG